MGACMGACVHRCVRLWASAGVDDGCALASECVLVRACYFYVMCMLICGLYMYK